MAKKRTRPTGRATGTPKARGTARTPAPAKAATKATASGGRSATATKRSTKAATGATTGAKARGGGARAAASRASAARPARSAGGRSAALFAPLPGSEPRIVGGVHLDVVRAGAARVKREIYPPGFRWSTHMRPITGTPQCMHAHVGFLAHGEIHIEYADGCVVEHRAPQVVAIEPGHDGWVVGSQPAVLIEFDFERETIARLGMPTEHRHD